MDVSSTLVRKKSDFSSSWGMVLDLGGFGLRLGHDVGIGWVWLTFGARGWVPRVWPLKPMGNPLQTHGFSFWRDPPFLFLFFSHKGGGYHFFLHFSHDFFHLSIFN